MVDQEASLRTPSRLALGRRRPQEMVSGPWRTFDPRASSAEPCQPRRLRAAATMTNVIEGGLSETGGSRILLVSFAPILGPKDRVAGVSVSQPGPPISSGYRHRVASASPRIFLHRK